MRFIKRGLMSKFAIFIVLTAFLSAAAFAPAVAGAVQYERMKGQYGHFTVEPGKVYIWEWTEDKDEEGADAETAPECCDDQIAAIKSAAIGKGEAAVVSVADAREIKDIIEAIKAAAESKDIQGLMKYFAPESTVEIVVISAQGVSRTEMNREEYEKTIIEGWAQTTEYEYSTSNESIIARGDGKGLMVEANVHESMMMDGKKVTSNTHEILMLEKRSGRYLIIKVIARSTLSVSQ